MRTKLKVEKDRLLEAFWERGLVLFGERVQQEYALRTPIFIDLRHRLYEDLETLTELGRALHAKLAAEVGRDAPPQQVIGIPDTATPIALAAALASRGSAFPLSYGQLRKKPANYPGGRWGVSSFMGERAPGREVTLIDDVMASGRTKLWSIDELAKDGVSVVRVLVVVDREQGGDEALAARRCSVLRLYSVFDIVDYYAETGRIDAATAAAAREHLTRRRF